MILKDSVFAENYRKKSKFFVSLDEVCCERIGGLYEAA